MKKFIFSAAVFFAATQLHSQVKNPNGQFGRLLIRDSVKLRGIWYKALSGNNLATANLSATGTYTHNWNAYSCYINNVTDFIVTRNSGGANLSFGIQPFSFAASAAVGAVNSSLTISPTNIQLKSDLVFGRIGNFATQPAKSVLSLKTPGTGEMEWSTPASIVSSGGGATAGQYWATGGNSSPGTTNFTLGSLSTDDVRFVSDGSEVIRLTKTGGVGVRTTSPNSSFDVSGSFGAKLIHVALDDLQTYTVSSSVSDSTAALTYVIDYNGLSKATFRFPNPANAKDRCIIIKRTQNDLGGILNIDVTGGGTLEDYPGSFTVVMSLDPTASLCYQSDGTKWWLLFQR
jgi:hypothetical protein